MPINGLYCGLSYAPRPLCSGFSALQKQLNHGLVKRWNVGWLAATDPILVLHHFFVLPFRTGIPQVVLNGVITGQSSVANEISGNKQPRSMTNDSDRFPGVIHFANKLLRSGVHS